MAHPSILDEILEAKRDEITALEPGRARLQRDAAEAPPPRDFVGALRGGDRVAVIAEIKRRSPSKGELALDLDAATTAKAYEAGGAAALSVLTDDRYFGGSLDDLRAARAVTDVPVLRKDFTLDALQVIEARAAGADAVLLIVAALPDDSVLRELREVAEGLGMAALVEADDEASVERALASGATVIGVTNRNLRTFGEDFQAGERLAQRLPAEVTRVAESAIRSVDDAERMAASGYHALLVGEHLVRSADPQAAVAALRVPRSGAAPAAEGG
ncbi:MAG: indole-3-glycerol phosphate synthase TrpC [Actinobacteria bacterium]|nr:indole-3-glycerol phosphate synthase TrpC [Actinomycetota bacterium]